MQRKDVHYNLEVYCDQNDFVCPFTLKKCKKISKTEIGICSYNFKGVDQILCPNIFLKSNFFEIIKNGFFTGEKISILKEVKYENNFFDYILIDELAKDYIIVEVQSLDTCGNYMSLFGKKVKPLSINWKTTLKTTIYQLILKSYIAQQFNRKIVLVCQDTFFEYVFGKEFQGKTCKEKPVHLLVFKYIKGEFISHTIYSFEYDEILFLYKKIISFKNNLDNIIFNTKLKL